MGTTSACAENTSRAIFTPPISWNYLRVRGEYFSDKLSAIRSPELPPRARRIRACGSTRWCGVGTTSACAENTESSFFWREFHRNYLRVRGEYRINKEQGELLVGTTSACAENTLNELGLL